MDICEKLNILRTCGQVFSPRFVPEKAGKSHADEARELIGKFGVKYSSKNGGSLLHKCVNKPRVYTYILANHGVPVNIQDINGDTALHLAVRHGRADIVEALVQCSADLTLRNKMGQMPVDEAEGTIKTFLETFAPGLMLAVTKRGTQLLAKFVKHWCNIHAVCKPGVVVTIRDSHFNKLLRLYKRSWCNVHTKVKEGKSLLEWTEVITFAEVKPGLKYGLKKETDVAKQAYRLLSEYRPTSELIHAVLCEDVELAQQVLQENRGLHVNIRFRDSIGKTLLCHAIETNNYKMVKLLLDHGAKVAQVRVRENEQTDTTCPLYQKALRRDLDVNIVKLLQSVLTDSTEHQEKDVNGNTPLLRAIENGVDTGTIRWLIKVRGVYSLFDRNKDGLTARELAHKRARDNTVKMIDRYIAKEVQPVMLRLFPVAFYPQELLTIVDEAGDSLEQKLNKFAEQHHEKTWLDYNKSQNGYSALTRAIAFNQIEAAKMLCTLRPALRKMGDNCGRYPLHYAYALPKDQGKPFIRLILDKDAKEIENRVDKDGRVAAVYRDLRGKKEIQQMLYDARTLDLLGKRGPPLGPWPKDAEKRPPTENDIELINEQRCV